MPERSTSSPSSPPPSPPTPSRPLDPRFSSREEEERWLGPTESSSDPGPASGAGSDDDPQGTTSDPGSFPSGEAKPLSRAALKNTIKQAIRTGTGAANRLLARNQVEQELGLWRADDEDLEGISTPLASIAHRRGGVAGITTANPDVADAIATLIALAGYVSKQFALRLQARAYAQAALAQQQQADEGSVAA